MPDQPKPAPDRFDHFFGLLFTLLCWFLIGSAFALASMKEVGPANATLVWLSILSGPFAFFDSPPDFSLGEKLLMALISLAPVGLRLRVRRPETSFLAALGISFWFMMGLGLTFIGV